MVIWLPLKRRHYQDYLFNGGKILCVFSKPFKGDKETKKKLLKQYQKEELLKQCQKEGIYKYILAFAGW